MTSRPPTAGAARQPSPWTHAPSPMERIGGAVGEAGRRRAERARQAADAARQGEDRRRMVLSRIVILLCVLGGLLQLLLRTWHAP